MVEKIVIYPNKVLQVKAAEIREITPSIKELAQNMKESLVQSHGLGLAASQIGHSKKMIAIQTEKGPRIFINPKIVKKSRQKEVGEEGCLSFPDLYLKIKRHCCLEVRALTLNGNKVKIRAKGLMARVFQHEIDHLNGVLFIDRIGFCQRIKVKRKLKNIKHD